MTTKNITRVADVMDQEYLLVEGMATVAEALMMLRERNARFLIGLRQISGLGNRRRHDLPLLGVLGRS